MELTNEFEVGTSLDRAWEILTDVERIAPCLPGAELREIEDDEYRGVVKVKVGPITAEYRGAAHFLEKNTDTHTAVLRAEGREARGQGNASATITAVLKAVGEGTHVSVVTDLSISGKVAQFGRGVLAEVSAKLLQQFVRNLESTVLAGDSASSPSSGTSASTGTGTGTSAGAASEGAATASLAEARTSRKGAPGSTGAAVGASESRAADGESVQAPESGKAGQAVESAAPGKAAASSKASAPAKATAPAKVTESTRSGVPGKATEPAKAAGKGGELREGEGGKSGEPATGKRSGAGKAEGTSVVDAPEGGSRNGSDDAGDEEPETSHSSHAHDEHRHDREDDDVSSNGATVRRLEPRPAEPVDLIEFAGPSLVRRALPAALVAVGLAALAMVVRRLLK